MVEWMRTVIEAAGALGVAALMFLENLFPPIPSELVMPLAGYVVQVQGGGALIDENMPVIVITTNRSAYDKIVSNIQEVKARKGFVIAIVNEGDTVIRQMADHVIEIPDTEEPFTPLLSVIPLQLLSYHIALMRGCNVDQPRNLAKSVTVE